MRKKWSLALGLMMAIVLVISPMALAFSDISGDPAENKIHELRQQGIVNGVSETEFSPQGELNYAQAVHLISKATGLSAENFDLIPELAVSDYYANVPDHAWFSSSFMAAALHELPVPKDANPSLGITREQFAHLLFHALIKTGDYAFTEQFIMIEDEAQVAQEYMDSIQKLLVSHIATLNSDNHFRPKDVITRSEAAGWIYETIQFIAQMKEQQPEAPQGDVNLITEEEAEGVTKATLVWPEAPHPGYGLAIHKIEFDHETMEAVIVYRKTLPDPDRMYPQVITEVSVVTYVDSRYTVTIQESQAGGGSSSHPGSPSLDSPVSHSIEVTSP